MEVVEPWEVLTALRFRAQNAKAHAFSSGNGAQPLIFHSTAAIIALHVRNFNLSGLHPSPPPSLAASLAPLFVDRAPDALLAVAADGSIVFANPACADILGYSPAELIGLSVEALIPDEARARHRQSRADFLKSPARRSMGRLNHLSVKTKSGAVRPVDIALSPLGVVDGLELTAVVIRDATALRALMHELEAAAATDSLTGALNRRSFGHAYGREAERCHRQGLKLHVMMIDIDHFKKVNDRYGHAAGDEALRALVSACATRLRKTDVLARIGGEEFAILAAASVPTEALHLAERLREKITTIRVTAGEETFGFTASIGVAEAHVPDEPVDDVLARADAALYEAKRTGRNRVVQHETPARIQAPGV